MREGRKEEGRKGKPPFFRRILTIIHERNELARKPLFSNSIIINCFKEESLQILKPLAKTFIKEQVTCIV